MRNPSTRTQRVIVLVVAACLFTLAAVPATAETAVVRLDARGMERDARLANLRFDTARNEITLDDMELVEDDASGSGVPEGLDRKKAIWKEYLKRGVVAKKVLMLDNPAAFSGRIMFEGTEMKGNTEPLHIFVNGVECMRPASRYSHPFTVQYTEYLPYDCWYSVDLPVGALKKGPNEVLMRAESDSASW